MSDHDETRWRQALESRGSDWVTRELQLRAGQPNDYLLDVVYEAPHPTREFCQRWCAEQENKMAGLSLGTMSTMLILIFLMTASTLFARRDLERALPAQTVSDMR
jgi:hypothetical protein